MPSTLWIFRMGGLLMNQGCSQISSSLILYCGSVLSSFIIRSFATPLKLLGHLIRWFIMLSNKIDWFAPSKGGLPVSSSNNKTPRFQMSRLLSCPLCLIISGARYSGVPQYVYLLVSSLKKFDQPKSATLTAPSPSSKIFSGLISLWIIGGSKLWRYLHAWITSRRYYADTRSLNLPSRLMSV